MLRDPRVKAAEAHRRLIGQLCRSDEPRAAALAALLKTCTASQPCRSAACPICGLSFQQAAVAVVDQFVRVPARAFRNRMTALTIVPASGYVSPDRLTLDDFVRVAAEISAALAAIDLPPIIVGLEVSFNEDCTGKFEPHWSIHGHAILIDWLSKSQRRAVKAAFSKSPLVRLSVLITLLDQDLQGRLYPFKSERIRRVTVLKTDHPTRAPFRKPKRRDLRPHQAVSLAIVEHEFGFGRRLLTHGIDEQAVRRCLEGLGWARDGP